MAGYLLPAFLPDKLPAPARWLVEPGGPLASKAGKAGRGLGSVFQDDPPQQLTQFWWVFFLLKNVNLPTYFGVSLNGGTPRTPQNDHF